MKVNEAPTAIIRFQTDAAKELIPAVNFVGLDNLLAG